MSEKMRKVKNNEAEEILNIYLFFHKDGSLYLGEDDASLDELFEAVVMAINTCGSLKPQLPYNEFVRPSQKVLESDAGWVGHFEERDNRRFFLSDIYDYLTLLYGRKREQ